MPSIGSNIKALTTGDIYRYTNAPPAAPDVAAVPLTLLGDFANGHAPATTGTTTLRWTHIILLPLTTDIRDGYVGGGPSGETVNTHFDTVYIPDKNGTAYAVIFAERARSAGGGDYMRAYVQRQTPSWGSLNNNSSV